jgi:WS/DGAT/MGAT family acyltransferase
LKPLSGLDSLFLHLETPETPMHVGSLHVCDLPEGYDGDFCADMTRQIAQRMHLAPLFRRRLRTLPLAIANPVWVDDGPVDLDYHVRRERLARPGTPAQLEACVARLHARPLDRSRPLWEARVVEGLATGQVGLYVKVHHAVLDGAAGIALADVLLDRTPSPRAVPRPPRGRREADAPGLAVLAGAALRHDVVQYAKLVRHLPDLVSAVAGIVRGPRTPGSARPRRGLVFGPRTPLNVAITAERTFATASIALDEAKAVAQAFEATLNDVVLAVCSGALRSYLSEHGGIPEEPLVAGMPFSLRQAGDTAYSTQATMTLVSLATDIGDPVERLLAIRDGAGAVKAAARRHKSIIPADTPSLGAPWLLGGLAALYGRSKLADTLPPVMNVVISNVPGPAVPLYAAGARIRTYWPLSIVEHGMGLNITVVSYCGTLDFGLVAARRAVPDVRKIARAVEKAHAELLRLARAGGRRSAGRVPAAAAPRLGGSETRR